MAKVQEIKTLLTKAGLSAKIDDSGVSVGKRYARTDECGIPYAFTVDFETLENQTITMRELDTMKQIRLPIAEAAPVLTALTTKNVTWAECLEKYGEVAPKE
jgi:glycyl-tRNA synthetase